MDLHQLASLLSILMDLYVLLKHPVACKNSSFENNKCNQDIVILYVSSPDNDDDAQACHFKASYWLLSTKTEAYIRSQVLVFKINLAINQKLVPLYHYLNDNFFFLTSHFHQHKPLCHHPSFTFIVHKKNAKLVRKLNRNHTYDDFPLPVGPRMAFIPGLKIPLSKKNIRK